MLSILKHHTILYVEDELKIQSNIVEYLESYFDIVYVASDGEEALRLYYYYSPDILLLDINLPLKDGLSVALEVRSTNSIVRIIMLTAHTETEKLLIATELKLTKYLIKPIAPKEFKETMKLLAKELTQYPSHLVHLNAECVWDKNKEILTLKGMAIFLTHKEHKLFKLLIKNKTQTVYYNEIMAIVWEDALEQDISFDSVKNQVSKLRKKLPLDTLKSVYGQGYVLL